MTEERRRLIEHIVVTDAQMRRLMMRRHMDDWLHLELTMPQLKVIFLLHEGEKTMSELAGSLGVSLSTVTGVIDRLVAEGLVSRKADRIDRRRVVTCLTGRADQLMEGLQVEGYRIAAEILESLTQEQLQIVSQAVDLVRAAAVALVERPEQRNLAGG